MFGKEDGTWCVSRLGENICLSWASLPPFIDECAAFFKEVYVEHLDYKECMKKWDCSEALFYIDPPYESVEKDFYHVNKEEGFSHKDLSEVIKKSTASCAISYYDSPFIRSLYLENDGFEFYETKVTKHMQTIKKKSIATEVLIIKKSQFAKENNIEMCY